MEAKRLVIFTTVLLLMQINFIKSDRNFVTDEQKCIETCGIVDEDVMCQQNGNITMCNCMYKTNSFFDSETKRCRGPCWGCFNGATCNTDPVEENAMFCSCLPGTSGNQCNVVDDCKDKYKSCIGTKGKCSYNVENMRAECNCSGKNRLKDLGGFCEDCDCGPDSEDCSFVKDVKTCKCKKGYKDNQGTCEECQCGENSKSCGFKDGKKICNCTLGFADNAGTCEVCDCGEKSISCNFEKGKKKCQCPHGYEDIEGKCEGEKWLTKSDVVGILVCIIAILVVIIVCIIIIMVVILLCFLNRSKS